MCAISIGWETEPLAGCDFAYLENVTGARFRYFRKSRPARDSAWSGNGTVGIGRSRLFAKRGQYMDSLLLEITIDARSQLAGERSRWPVPISLIRET